MRREVKIGIFAVLMIGALWAGIRFLKGFDIFSRNAVYHAAYDQVDGVQNASPILIRGVKVGAVTDTSFDPSIGNEVVLQLTIQRKYRIPSNSEARIYSNSIMGAKAIEIALGDAGTYLQSGDTLCSSRSKGLMDMAGSELEFFKQKMSQVVGDLSRTMDNLNLIIGAERREYRRYDVAPEFDYGQRKRYVAVAACESGERRSEFDPFFGDARRELSAYGQYYPEFKQFYRPNTA